MLAALGIRVRALDLGERGERGDGLQLAPPVAQFAEDQGAAGAVPAEAGEVAADQGERRAQAECGGGAPPVPGGGEEGEGAGVQLAAAGHVARAEQAVRAEPERAGPAYGVGDGLGRGGEGEGRGGGVRRAGGCGRIPGEERERGVEEGEFRWAVRHGQHRAQAAAGLGQAAAQQPPPGEGRGQPDGLLRIACLRPAHRLVQGRPQVARLRVQPGQPGPLSGAAQLGLGVFGQRPVVEEVPVPYAGEVLHLVEPLGRVRGDGLQEPVAGAGGPGRHHHQRPVDQPGDQVQHLVPGDAAPAQTASAAARSQPSVGAARRRRTMRSGALSSSQLQSITARSVCWRAGAPRCPRVRTRKRSLSRAANSLTPRARTRVAASSSASGMPSRRRQISATARRSGSSGASGSRGKPGWMRRLVP